MFRRMATTLLGGLIPALLMGSIGCNSDGVPGDQDDLQALLRDRELTLQTSSALSKPPADAGMTSPGMGADGGFAGSIGSADGGATGGADAPTDGGTTMGAAGVSGSAGASGSAGGTVTDGGFGGTTGAPSPLGTWSFDDCSTSRTDLFDSGPNGNTAFRSVGAQCAPGISGQ
ncbi:MAG TPA: hypothetical protein VK989_16975, partial [Polyangia bacterium]|nr:hypothetical protein [Polyangia bacterium]